MPHSSLSPATYTIPASAPRDCGLCLAIDNLYSMIMSWYQRHGETAAYGVLLLALLVLVSSICTFALARATRDSLLTILPAAGTLIFALAAVWGLQTWKQEAKRHLARELLTSSLVLQDNTKDAALKGSESARALMGLVGEKGEIRAAPWSSKEAACARILEGLKESRIGLLQAYRNWMVSLAEAEATGWDQVVQAATQIKLIVDPLLAELLALMGQAEVFAFCTCVAEYEKRRATWKSQEDRLMQVSNDASRAPEAFRQALRPQLKI
jgi:hypothetical protein